VECSGAVRVLQKMMEQSVEREVAEQEQSGRYRNRFEHRAALLPLTLHLHALVAAVIL